MCPLMDSACPSQWYFWFLHQYWSKLNTLNTFSWNIELYIRKNAQLVFAWSQAWTWLSWPAWTVLLTGLNMHVGTDCSWFDERTDLNNVVGTIMINQGSYMIELQHVVWEWWNKIEQRCYNNRVLHVLTHTQTIPVDSSSYIQCWNMIEQYCYFTNPVFTRAVVLI